MQEKQGEPFNPYSKQKQISPKYTVKTTSGMNFYLDRKYSFIKCIGEGSYGVVISVEEVHTGNKLAIKKIPQVLKDVGNGFRVYREICIMKHCDHDNILKLIDISLDPDVKGFSDLYMTMELMETDLSRVIYSKQTLTDDHVQFFVYQILRGLKYLHSANIIHRDLKPSNLLVNSNCDLKICDFNLARGYDQDEVMTEYVVTRWYRAPEVMLSSQQYSKAVDVWSVGCIMGELINRRVLFQGTNYLNQIKLYCDLLGIPSEEDLGFISNSKGQKYIRSLNKVGKDFKVVFPTATDLGRDLLKRMLVMNPNKRITVEEALEHPYFDEIHDPKDEPVCDIPFELDVDDSKLSSDQLRDFFIDLASEYRK